MPNYVQFDEDWDEVVKRGNVITRMLRDVGHDCLPDVLRARVRQVQTRTPHPHYL